MRIVVDLQCCQTAAQTRGMGRYSAALTREIVQLGHEHEFIFLLNYKYLAQSHDIVAKLREIGTMGNVVYHDYPDVQCDPQEREAREHIANSLRNNRIETFSPDLYHISSLFEGEAVFGAAASFLSLPKRNILRSATLYDFIPYLYPQQYLNHPQYKAWYNRTLSVARNLDIGLAISETTKIDAQKLLKHSNIEIANIYGSVSGQYRVLPEGQSHRGMIWRTLKSDQRFILYVGGPDPRKNVDATLRAFAIMQQKVHAPCMLVLVYDVKESELRDLQAKIEALGVCNSVLVTGFISDDELVELYNACELFIFPSLYEGLGLPVIEAMRCGAPVLVGNNSSQREIIDRDEYRFNAESDTDIASKVADALNSPAQLADMRSYSIKRAQDFSWQNSARIALNTWEQAFERQTSNQSLALGSLTSSRKRCRIAMFTPLPEAATGIADYAADFVPQLANLADVDLFVEDVAAVKFYHEGGCIRHHSEIINLVESYDAIVYQLGNSPYHHYMLSYIQRFPGVVVIHDAFLGHLSNNPDAPAAFAQQVIGDHGGAARAILTNSKSLQDGVLRLIMELTCSPTHVRRSLGVIVHSKFAKKLLQSDARAVYGQKIVIVPQYVAPISKERKDRMEARKHLGLSPDGVVIASFGHVAPTKGVLDLIASFSASEVGRSGQATLIFVGEIEGGQNHPSAFGREVLNKLVKYPNIIITGYVQQKEFELYLGATDFAVQLRTITRGETSRAMISLIVNQIPFVYNRFGPSAEIPDSVAFGIDSTGKQTLADALDRLATDSKLLAAISKAQGVYRDKALDGSVVAEHFIRVVTGMVGHARACHPASLSAEIARIIHRNECSAVVTQEAAAAFVNQERAESSPRLLIDVSHIREHDLQTGVQRVVRQFTRAAYSKSDRSTSPQAFAFTENGLIFADDYAQVCGARHDVEKESTQTGMLRVRPFDRMLLADGDWHLSDWMVTPLEQLNSVGGSAYALIHDILPLQQPELFHEHVSISVRRWLSLMAQECAGLICTSRTAADGIIEYLNAQSDIEVRPGLRIGWSHLGSDPLVEVCGVKAPRSMLSSLQDKSNLYLVVGTIEPRKGHEIVLDAFDKIWQEDVDATLVFVGKRGWNIDALISRMDAHPEAGRRFFEVGFVDDNILRGLYKTARSAIVPSIAEGFGLPIFEAAHLGTPLILSDLPVFRELGGQNARYFQVGSSADLSYLIRESLDGKISLLQSDRIAPPTWMQCYDSVARFINGLDTYWKF